MYYSELQCVQRIVLFLEGFTNFHSVQKFVQICADAIHQNKGLIYPDG